MKIEILKEDLQKLYVEENKMIKEIAEIYRCSVDTIRRRLQQYGFKKGTSYKEPKKVDKLADKKKYMKDLYLKGKTCREIGNILNLSEKTVSYHLRKLGVEIRSQKKIHQDKFEELWNKGKSDLEIALYFGVEESTIQSFRTRGKNAGKFNRNFIFQKSDIQLSEIQEQMVLGSLLGDLSISLYGEMKNAKLNLHQSAKQKELFIKKVEILGDFMSSYNLYKSKPDPRTGNIYYSYKGISKSHPVFTEIYNLTHPNKVKKEITQKYLNRIYHPIALAHWYMDDGTKTGVLCTQCFSEKEIDLLITWLNTNWNIKCTKQRQLDNFVIYIKQSSRLDFERLIFPYLVPSMYYKLKFLDTLMAESA